VFLAKGGFCRGEVFGVNLKDHGLRRWKKKAGPPISRRGRWSGRRAAVMTGLRSRPLQGFEPFAQHMKNRVFIEEQFGKRDQQLTVSAGEFDGFKADEAGGREIEGRTGILIQQGLPAGGKLGGSNVRPAERGPGNVGGLVVAMEDFARRGPGKTGAKNFPGCDHLLPGIAQMPDRTGLAEAERELDVLEGCIRRGGVQEPCCGKGGGSGCFGDGSVGNVLQSGVCHGTE